MLEKQNRLVSDAQIVFLSPRCIFNAIPHNRLTRRTGNAFLPQVSDALLMMVQFDTALAGFKDRYHELIKYDRYNGEQFWITKEQLAKWDTEDAELSD